MTLDELEHVYCDAPAGPPPAGRYQGHFLHWLDTLTRS